jgi:nucleoside-diphosphate-sugar epimerase
VNGIVEADLREITDDPLPFERFRDRTILVSGAAGSLPAYLVEALLYLNQRRPELNLMVIGLVRNLAKARARFERYSGRGDLELILQDLGEPFARRDLPADFVVHAASPASPRCFGTDPVGTIAPNLFGTWSLLELARERHTEELLFISTSEVYGRSDRARIAEDDYGHLDPLELRSCYAESKRMGENLCAVWSQHHGVRAKIVRPFHVYGPGMTLGDGRAFSDFVGDVVAGRDIEIRSDGTATRTYCYLADAVRGFFSVLLKGEPGRAYNLGNPAEALSVEQLARLLVSLFPEKGLKVLMRPEGQRAGYLPSKVGHTSPEISRLQALGWGPRHTAADGFRRTVESYRDH